MSKKLQRATENVQCLWTEEGGVAVMAVVLLISSIRLAHLSFVGDLFAANWYDMVAPLTALFVLVRSREAGWAYIKRCGREFRAWWAGDSASSY